MVLVFNFAQEPKMKQIALQRTDIKQESYDNAIPIWGKQTTGQTFKANSDNLSIVKVFTFRSPYVEGAKKKTNKEQIVFHLREGKVDQDLRTIIFSGVNVFDGDWLRLQFVPINDSKGKNYYFFFESQSSTQENAINLANSTANVYEDGSTAISGKLSDGDLRFQSFYSQPFQSLVHDIASDFSMKFRSDLTFSVFWIFLIVLIFYLLFKKLVKR